MKVYFFILSSFIFCLSERYHTFYEVEQQLLDWEVEFSNNNSPWPAQYPESGIIYSLHQIGLSENDQLPIYAVKLSYNANEDEDEPRILILEPLCNPYIGNRAGVQSALYHPLIDLSLRR